MTMSPHDRRPRCNATRRAMQCGAALALGLVSIGCRGQTVSSEPPTRPATLVVSSCDFVSQFQVTARNLERDNFEPRISLEVTIDADSSMVDAKVIDGNVNTRMARWALREIRLCRFTPALAAGVPVRSVVQLRFGLSDKLLAAGGKVACSFPVTPREGFGARSDTEVVVRVRFEGGRQLAGVEVTASSGVQAIDRAAVEAARSCRPASEGPAPDSADIRFQFKP